MISNCAINLVYSYKKVKFRKSPDFPQIIGKNELIVSRQTK